MNRDPGQFEENTILSFYARPNRVGPPGPWISAPVASLLVSLSNNPHTGVGDGH